MHRILFRATLTVAVAASLLDPDGAAAQSRRAGPATDFVFDSAFVLDPPDPGFWEPPPGGFLEDGRYVARETQNGREIFLTLRTEYSGALLQSPEWTSDTFILAYQQQLLEADLADLRERDVSRAVLAASARLDLRFSLPAIERRVLLGNASGSSGPATRAFATYSWRFPHPGSPILEFVVSISTVVDPGEPVPDIKEEQLAFLNSLEALPLDSAPDTSIALPARHLDAIAKGHEALWVTDSETRMLIRVDPRTQQVTATVPVGAGPHSIEISEQAVWVTNHNDDSLTRVNPVDNSVTATANVPTGPHQIVDHSSGLWLVADASCTITEVDRETAEPTGDLLGFGSVRRSLTGRRERLWGILGQRAGRCTDLSITMAGADTGELYVFERFKGTLTRIDTGRDARPVETRAEIGGFLVRGDDLWGVDDLVPDGRVYRVDVSSGKIIATLESGMVSGTPVFAGGLIWIARERDNSIIRIDSLTNSIVGSPIPVGRPASMVAADTGVWIAAGKNIVHIPVE